MTDAPDAGKMAEELGYLIEKMDVSKGVFYLRTFAPEWTQDANKALRFHSRADADDCSILCYEAQDARVVEHMWPALRSPQPAGGETGKLAARAKTKEGRILDWQEGFDHANAIIDELEAELAALRASSPSVPDELRELYRRVRNGDDLAGEMFDKASVDFVRSLISPPASGQKEKA